MGVPEGGAPRGGGRVGHLEAEGVVGVGGGGPGRRQL